MAEFSIRLFIADCQRSLNNRGYDVKIKDLKDAYDAAGEMLLALGVTPKL